MANNLIKDGVTSKGGITSSDIANKQTNKPTSVASNKKIRSTDWNVAIAGLQDSRDWFKGTVVESIAGLRGVSGTKDGAPGFVTGYYAPHDGGEGPFRWDSTSTDDDDGGMTIKPTAVSGAGRWKRLLQAHGTRVNVKHFGAKGDYSADDTDAFLNAIAYIETIVSLPPFNSIPNNPNINEGCVLFVPLGWYKVQATLVFRRSIHFLGERNPLTGAGSQLIWSKPGGADINGIDIPTTEAGTNNSGVGCTIENLGFFGPYSASPWPTLSPEDLQKRLDSYGTDKGSGLLIRVPRVTVRRCYFNGWLWDGVNIQNDVAEDNCNLTRLYDCLFGNNGRHGVFLQGNNSSACYTEQLSGEGGAGGYLIFDRSFLGNTHVAPHSEGYTNDDGNGHSYYSARNNNCVFIGAYQEASDGPASFGLNTVVIGGTWGNGIATTAGDGTPGNVDAEANGDPILTAQLRAAPSIGMSLKGCVLDGYPYFPTQTFTAPSTNLGSVYAQHLLDASSNNMTVNLTSPAFAVQRQLFFFKRIDTVSANSVTLGVQGIGNTIDGLSTVSMAPGDCIAVIADSTEYKVVWRYTASSSAPSEPEIQWSMVDGGYTNSVTAGAFTEGMQFQILAAATVTGGRFYYPDSTSRSVTLTLWDDAGGVLATKTATFSSAGVKTLSFDTPYSLTGAGIYRKLTMSLFTSGEAIFGPAKSSVSIPSTPALLGPHYLLLNAGTEAAGASETWPDPNTTVANVIEPVFTVP